MKKLLLQSGALLLVLGPVTIGHATLNQYIPVFCDKGHSLQFALDRATEGAGIDVWGTCNESVVIETDRMDIGTFSGQTAIINPPAGSPAITISSADNASIQGLTINVTGDAPGIDLRLGATAAISVNRISGGAIGIRIAKGSSADVQYNEILDSSSAGILIDGSSYGAILNNVLHSTSGNFSQIFVTGSSSADVSNNTITASSGSGIEAVFTSNVTASGNYVSGADGAGIVVQQNAHMFLPADSPNTIEGNPSGQAIHCGSTGSLRIDAEQVRDGSVNLDPGCEVTNFNGVPLPLVVNGDFEKGHLTGWTASGIFDGFANVVQEGTCFSANNTLGLTFNGDFAANVRSSGPAPISSVGILTSQLFEAGASISFRALSENSDLVPDPDPVTLEVEVLNTENVVMISQLVQTNIVTLDEQCPGGGFRDGVFSTHFIDTSDVTGDAVRVQFRQHTNVGGLGFFTLIDDVKVIP